MKTYHIITIGCQMNQADSERMAGRLEKCGYKKTDDKYGADLVIVNTCGVRQSAENRIYGLIPKIKKENPRAKIVLTGCLAERKDVKRRLKNYVDIWLPTNRITNYELRIMNKMPRGDVGRDNDDYLELQPKYSSKFSAFVPIGNGCDNFCSYCVVPYARGREVYRRAQDILAEVKNLVKRGYKEVILVAQNVNSYKSGKPPKSPFTRGIKNSPPSKGGYGGFDFADLLKMVNDIPGDFWIRFLTSHPKDMSEKLIKTMAGSKKICQQIHLPAQAGDDIVLERMNRGYAAADYLELVNKIREVLNFQFSNKSKIQNPKLNSPRPALLKRAIWQPPVSLTTDIIVGFPGETKKQFNNTVKLFKQVKFDMAYISEYSPRPGTAAFKLSDNVSREEKEKRKNKLDKILRLTALANNKKYIGKTVRVLIERGDGAGEWFGKTETGKDIRFYAKPSTCQIGDFVEVEVTQVREFCLSGMLVK